MSTNLNYKQVANVERRTWDLEAYKKRATERQTNDEEGGKNKNKKIKGGSQTTLLGGGPPVTDDGLKEEFQPAVRGAAGPEKSDRAFLKARRKKVDVDSKIGSVEMINPDAVATTKSVMGEPGSIKEGVTKSGVGWHCKVCDCFLRDSHTYLDHINGRKHQKNLGFTMRVERSTQDQVSSRLALLAKEKEMKKKSMLIDDNAESFEVLVLAKDEEAQKRREERARQRKERKQLKKLQPQPDQSNDEEEDAKDEEEEAKDDVEAGEEAGGELEEELEEEEVNPDIAAMMGFSRFA